MLGAGNDGRDPHVLLARRSTKAGGPTEPKGLALGVIPPLMVVLGILSLVGSGDLWIFNNVLALVLLLGGLALIAAIGVLIKREARPRGSTTD